MLLIRGKALNNIECQKEAKVSHRDKPIYGSCRLLIDCYFDTKSKTWYQITQEDNPGSIKYVNPILEISYFLGDDEYSRIQGITKDCRYELSINPEYLFVNPKHKSLRKSNSLYLFVKIFGNYKRVPLVQEIGETQIPVNDTTTNVDGFAIINNLVNYHDNKVLAVI